MSTIDKAGILTDIKVIVRRYPAIEHGKLTGVHAIVVHQTDAPTVLTFADVYKHPEISYKSPGEAATATWK